MAIVDGHVLQYRFQGVTETCWLQCIEMIMLHKHGTIYGVDAMGNPRTAHTEEVQQLVRQNSGSGPYMHPEYGLVQNMRLKTFGSDLEVWRGALRRGPVYASGRYAWSTFNLRTSHAIVIAGVSNSGQLAFYNPNVFGLLPHPVDHISYMSVERCMELADIKPGHEESPFWQCAEDVPETDRG